jgi:hypothetical protein
MRNLAQICSLLAACKKLPTSYGKQNAEKNSFEYIIDRHTFSGSLGRLTRVVPPKRVGLEGAKVPLLPELNDYFIRHTHCSSLCSDEI